MEDIGQHSIKKLKEKMSENTGFPEEYFYYVDRIDAWRWYITTDKDHDIYCDECNCPIVKEICFYNNKRNLCLNCVCFVLNSVESQFEEAKEKKNYENYGQ